MSIASDQAYVAYLADGVTTRFPLPFAVSSADELRVVWADDQGWDVAYRPGQDFTLGNNQVLFGQPPPTGRRLTLARAIALTQPVTLAESDRFYARTIETALDRLTSQIQRVGERAERSPALPLSAGLREVGLQAPVSGAVLRWDDQGQALISDGDFGTALLTARDQVLVARDAAEAAATLAQQAASLAPAAIAAADRAEQAAARAEAAQAIVLQAAERASWALGLMGLANNLAQLLSVVAPFLSRLFGIWRDFGWIDQAAQSRVDFGWACPPVSTGQCLDFGRNDNDVTAADDWLTQSASAQDWGLIRDLISCSGATPCQDDLGWINSVLPLSSAQPIQLPIRVPDPCPVIFAEPQPARPVPVSSSSC